jgi:hypothetical protein
MQFLREDLRPDGEHSSAEDRGVNMRRRALRPAPMRVQSADVSAGDTSHSAPQHL